MWHEYLITLGKETEHLLLETKLRNRKVNSVEDSDEMVDKSLLEKFWVLLLRRLGKSSCEVHNQVVDCKLKDFWPMSKLNIEVEQSTCDLVCLLLADSIILIRWELRIRLVLSVDDSNHGFMSRWNSFSSSIVVLVIEHLVIEGNAILFQRLVLCDYLLPRITELTCLFCQFWTWLQVSLLTAEVKRFTLRSSS